METLDLLQELVSNFPGTVLLVSHDRDFLDRTVTSIIAPEGKGRWLEYAGGYSDMIAQRKGREIEQKNVAKSSSPQTSAPAERTKKETKQKLSYKQKYALEKLPSEIDALHNEIAKMEKEFSDPDLYTKNAKRFEELSRLLEQKRKDLEAKENEWLELEMLKEELEK